MNGIHTDLKRFTSAEVAAFAARLEEEFRTRFRAYGTDLKIAPHGFSHLSTVGEGFELQLHPDDPGTWDHWGDFESCIEIMRRPRFSRAWAFLKRLEDVEKWARSELESYVRTLEEAHASPSNPALHRSRENAAR